MYISETMQDRDTVRIEDYCALYRMVLFLMASSNYAISFILHRRSYLRNKRR